jgi:MutS domain V
VMVFAGLAWTHDRVIRARETAARAVAFYERGIARIEDRWIGTGETGERFRDDAHPYAADLDLFGRGSLFELLSVARTRAGEEILAGWLTRPAERVAILDRHEAIRELTDELDLREALSVAGIDIRAGVHTDELVAWAEGPPRLAPSWHRRAAVAMTIATVASAGVLAATGGYVPLLVALTVQGLFRLRQQRQIDGVLHAAATPARDLAILLDLVRRLERHHFRSARLAALREEIAAPGANASRVIVSLVRLVEAHDWEHNLVFTPIAVLLMWGTHVAWAIERWRGRHGRRLGAWLRAVGEIEALASLAAYRYEHPGDPFPDIAHQVAGRASHVEFDGAGLGHPLLPSARMVPNDVAFAGEVGLLVVSGSNMSGKSTLLRTVGVNAVLALAGGPVRARSLRLSPVAIGATLRIQDSLQEGRSRFYAEITRVRAIVDLAQGPQRVLFLLDELFHGTNSHDRLVGASGVLRCLLDFGAIGLVTTHDLALTAVADRLAPRASNVHFEDRFEGGDMLFDYEMKPGPVTRSNALALMQAVGLEVGE